MKKVLLTLMVVIVGLGVLAGAGFAGYRVGYNQGVSGDTTFIGPKLMPMHGFDREFGPGFNSFRHPMMGRSGFDFNFFSPLRFLWNIAILALVVWFVYWIFTQSGWRITRQADKEQEIPPAKTER